MTHPPYRGRARTNGFTLIEVLVAIAIAALLLGGITAGLTRVLACDRAASDYDELALAVRTWVPRTLERTPHPPDELNLQRVRGTVRHWPEGSVPDRAVWKRHTLYVVDRPERCVDIWIPLARPRPNNRP